MELNLQNAIKEQEILLKNAQAQEKENLIAFQQRKNQEKIEQKAVSNADQHQEISKNQMNSQMDQQSQSQNEQANQSSLIDEGSSSLSSSCKKDDLNINCQKPHRQQKYKRSTNNSHKKFISVARRWMLKNNRSQLKNQFQTTFHGYKSTRTYFFIILAFIKNAMSEGKKEQFKAHFLKQIQQKIKQYQNQIQSTPNQNLKHFRGDEITDLKFAIKAFTCYFQGDNQKAIQCVYKKDKATIVKKQHYDQALKTLNRVQKQFSQPAYVAKTIRTQQNDTGKRRQRVRKPKQKQLKLQQQIQKLMDNQNFFYTPQMFGLKRGFNTGRKKSQKNTKFQDKKIQQSHQQQKKQNQAKQQNNQQFKNFSQKKQKFSPILLWNQYCSLNIKVPKQCQREVNKIKSSANKHEKNAKDSQVKKIKITKEDKSQNKQCKQNEMSNEIKQNHQNNIQCYQGEIQKEYQPIKIQLEQNQMQEKQNYQHLNQNIKQGVQRQNKQQKLNEETHSKLKQKNQQEIIQTAQDKN